MLQQWQEDLCVEGGTYSIGKEFEVPYWVIEADECVRKVLQSREQPYKLKYSNMRKRWEMQVSLLGRRLLNCIHQTDRNLVIQSYPRHRFSAYYDLLESTLKASGIRGLDLLPDTIERYAQFVDALRAKAKEEGFKKQMEGQRRAVRENRASLEKYLNDLFDLYARLLVVRVDLGFNEQFRASIGGAPNQHYVRRCFERFLKKLNRKFPDAVGYVRKLEYGPKSTFHYHLLLLFNGNKVREDITIANVVCDLWQEITEGNGRTWNCNRDKNRYRDAGKLGIGMIGYKDLELRRNLMRVASYLVKIDYYVRLHLPEGWRAFSHGVVPARKGARRGRRRSFKEEFSLQIRNLNSLKADGHRGAKNGKIHPFLRKPTKKKRRAKAGPPV